MASCFLLSLGWTYLSMVVLKSDCPRMLWMVFTSAPVSFSIVPIVCLKTCDVAPWRSTVSFMRFIIHLKAVSVKGFRNVPLVFLTGDEDVRTETEGLHAGAADFIRKPFAAEVLLKRVRNIIELNRLHERMADEIRAKTEKLSHAYLQIVQALAASVDAKDRYTHGHSSRVAKYAREIAMRAGFSDREQDGIYMMGLLHDVGKIGIPDAIINKTSRLTDEEFAQIKTHPAVGAEILAKITDLPELKTGARWHHERYDGRGYPDGLAGEAIPEVARIIAVADTYDAMTSNRSYRGQLPQAQVRAEIERCRGSQFDPRFADIMLAMIDEDTDFIMREV